MLTSFAVTNNRFLSRCSTEWTKALFTQKTTTGNVALLVPEPSLPPAARRPFPRLLPADSPLWVFPLFNFFLL